MKSKPSKNRIIIPDLSTPPLIQSKNYKPTPTKKTNAPIYHLKPK